MSSAKLPFLLDFFWSAGMEDRTNAFATLSGKPRACNSLTLPRHLFCVRSGERDVRLARGAWRGYEGRGGVIRDVDRSLQFFNLTQLFLQNECMYVQPFYQEKYVRRYIKNKTNNYISSICLKIIGNTIQNHSFTLQDYPSGVPLYFVELS